MLLALGVLSGCGSKEEGASDRTRRSKPVEFVKNTACAECHERQYKEWLGSHHDPAMQEAEVRLCLLQLASEILDPLRVLPFG